MAQELELFSLYSEDVTDEKQCDLFQSPLNVAYQHDMPSAAAAALAFRNRLNHGGLPYRPYQRGYFFPIAEIQKLLGQNNGSITGLKIYFGETQVGGEVLLDLIIVATTQNGLLIADDFNIPNTSSLPGAILGNARPCPSQCGKNNCLNTP